MKLLHGNGSGARPIAAGNLRVDHARQSRIDLTCRPTAVPCDSSPARKPIAAGTGAEPARSIETRSRPLPPLQTLQAFEIAGTCLSFRKAGDILHLTPSTISHQITALEQAMGAKLFRKDGRGVALTDAGRRYLETVVECLSGLRESGRSLAQGNGSCPLRMSAPPTFTNEVLMPALPAFWRQHPEVELRIVTIPVPMDSSLRDDLDVAVCFGTTPHPRLILKPLLAIDAVAVCTPPLAEVLSHGTPGDLSQVPLIHSSQMPNAWSDWAERAGVTLGQPQQNIWLDSYLAVMCAAEQGMGLALGGMPVINPMLRAGRLAVPWQIRVRQSVRYVVAYRKSDAERPRIAALLRWLQHAVKALPRIGAARPSP